MSTATLEAPAFQAGIYGDMPEDAYHGDPVPGGSLSQSGAKKLLPPSCPAKFAWERKHPHPPTDAMELGTAAHRLVLGTGADIVVVDAKDWRTKAAKEEADEVRSRGAVPLLPADYARVTSMAKALREHPLASAVFDPARGGHAEQSLFWEDQRWGIWRRCRIDWLPDLNRGKPYLADYKTCQSASPAAVAKSVANFRYFMQAPWYIDAVAAITGVRCPFVFVFQESTAPYLVTVCRLDGDAERAGRELNDQAMERYRDCTESGIWPGYSEDIEVISLPFWATSREGS